MFVWIVVTVGTHRHRHPAAGVRPAAGGWYHRIAALHLLQKSVQRSHSRWLHQWFSVRWRDHSHTARRISARSSCRTSCNLYRKRQSIRRKCFHLIQRHRQYTYASGSDKCCICSIFPCKKLTVYPPATKTARKYKLLHSDNCDITRISPALLT